MDKIKIKSLSLRCRIGARQRERRVKQTVVLDIAIHTPLSGDRIQDDLSKTVDYSDLCKRIVKSVRQSNFHLIESLAETVSRICLEDSRVKKAVVKVTKPKAISLSKGASVEITRHQSERPG